MDLEEIQLIEALIVVHLVFKNEEDTFKIESTRVVIIFLQLSVYGDFPDAQGQLAPQSKVRSGQILNSSENLCHMGVHVACKNEKDPINEVTGVVTTFLPL